MKKKLPMIGDMRYGEGFLWFPTTINDEMRWLRKASWSEQYQYGHFGKRWKKVFWIGA